ncbi:cytochrome P450 [Jackrogersella minutella]|nr:cytochrome P450 [Jackrogersella minutella]
MSLTYSGSVSGLAKLGITIFFALAIAKGIAYIFKPLCNKWSYSRAIINMRKHRAIANFDVLGENKLVDRLTSRAIPNTRFIEVFSINNSFTTKNETVHKQFIAPVRETIHNMDTNWTHFFGAADLALEHILISFRFCHDSITLASITRCFVFIAMLHTFFGLDPEEVDYVDATAATEAINNLWEESKKTQRADLREDQERLQAALRRMLPMCFPCKSEEHPLNIIMPSYETMWRVVLLTYVSAGLRSVDQETTEQFSKVVRSIPRCFDPDSKSDATETAINFAKEGLRLYPPTKRIHRAVPRDTHSGTYDIKAADVEWCHRDTRIWGPDAEEFRPSRFLVHTDTMKSAYMPFGAGRNRCPTASKFSYRAIMTLVAVMAKRMGDKHSGVKVTFNDAKLDEDLKALLPSGRMDMEDWKLARIDVD